MNRRDVVKVIAIVLLTFVVAGFAGYLAGSGGAFTSGKDDVADLQNNLDDLTLKYSEEANKAKTLESDLIASKALAEQYKKEADDEKIIASEALKNSGIPADKSAEDLVKEITTTVIEALKAKDMQTVSTYVHPANGLRFTPYTYVHLAQDLVFTSSQVAGLFSDTTVYNWGSFDGSGDPINMTYANYYTKFVYDVDFANPAQQSYNIPLGFGNMINNVFNAYPGSIVVEYHFPGFDPQYQGMDWRSLKLVYSYYMGNWYLVGIVHDQWTI